MQKLAVRPLLAFPDSQRRTRGVQQCKAVAVVGSKRLSGQRGQASRQRATVRSWAPSNNQRAEHVQRCGVFGVYDAGEGSGWVGRGAPSRDAAAPSPLAPLQ
eukprot:6115815-Prymnesium_polylepis.1